MFENGSESHLRDQLAQRLDLLEPGLSLIKDEYHLRNPDGARGFIDIFAKDRRGNLVVIELKRSDSTAREAITELAKYAMLLRAAKNLRSSELRLIVVSTTWWELRVPFSEFYHNTHYQLEGYQLEIGENGEIARVERLEPLQRVEGRKLCRRHTIFYYTSIAEMEAAEQQLAAESRKAGLVDFVIVRFQLEFDDPNYGATCALYYAQQLKDREYYSRILEHVCDAERLEEIKDYIAELDEEDAVDELADAITSEFSVEHVTLEIGYPERFSKRWHSGYWKLLGIDRFGIFQEDERLVDELLVEDLRGTTGTSFVHYAATFRFDNRSKVAEIRSNLNNALFQNDRWRHSVEDLLTYGARTGAEVGVLHVYNPEDILETIWMSALQGPEAFEPMFLLLLDSGRGDALEVFFGRLYGRSTSIRFGELLKTHFEGDFGMYINHRHFGSQREINGAVMESLGLIYTTDYLRFSTSEQSKLFEVVIRGSSVQGQSERRHLTFREFLLEHQPLVEDIVTMFSRHHMGGGMFQFGPDVDDLQS